MNNKTYKTIGEVAELLNLIDKNTGKKTTHTLRFWEKEFNQIQPKIFSGKRRYYDEHSIRTLKKIKFLLKEKGMTIEGAKNQINLEKTLVDENNISNINNTEKIKFKLKKISKLIKELKKN